jgi:hypothetical protein
MSWRGAGKIRNSNMTRTMLMISAGVLWLAQAAIAAGSSGHFRPCLFAAEGAEKIIRYDADGQVAWEYPAPMSRDVWLLPDGNILFCFNRQYDSARHDNPSGVMEVTPDKRVVFSFLTTGQVWSCQRLPDGNTLVGASSQGKLLVVSPEARIVKAVRLLSPPGHSCLRNARQLPNGHFLVAEEAAHAAREYSAEGALVREMKLAFAPYSVVRLENGNTVISGQQSLIELDPEDHILWSVNGEDLPELGIRWFAGIQVLPSGNIFVCNAGGKVPFVEFSPDHRVAWHSPDGITVPLGHGVQRVDVDGQPRK